MIETWASAIVKKTTGRILDVEMEPDEESATLRVLTQNARLDSRFDGTSAYIRWAVARVIVDYEPEPEPTTRKRLS